MRLIEIALVALFALDEPLRYGEVLRMSETGKPPAEQEPKPLVRLTGENGKVVYPKMIPDGKGGWKMADPAAVARLLGTPFPPPVENP